jgi:branched-chain amino acid transport system ATP-binding protein
MEFLQLLANEHAAIRRAVKVLEGMTDAAEMGVTINRHDVNALLIFLHYFGDSRHQAKEENVLFPVLRQRTASLRLTASQHDLLRDLLAEHNDERLLIEKVQLALFSDRPSEFVAPARRLTRMLSQHVLQEEQVLFPLAEKIVTNKEADDLLMHMEQADAEFGVSQYRLLMDLLQDLETKYLPKAA